MALLAGFHVLLVSTATALAASFHVLLMGCMIAAARFPAFAGDLALLGFIHRCESAVAFLIRHEMTPSEEQTPVLQRTHATLFVQWSNGFETIVKTISHQ